MKYAVTVAALSVGLFAGLSQVNSESTSDAPIRYVPVTKKDDIEHGRYIAHKVAMCIQCHSPRNSNGDLILSEAFHGAPIPVKSPYARSPWATRAPNIAGLPGYTEETAIRFLTTGKTRRGASPQAPMPPFRLSVDDARAVVLFLKSVR